MLVRSNEEGKQPRERQNKHTKTPREKKENFRKSGIAYEGVYTYFCLYILPTYGTWALELVDYLN